MTSVLGVNYTHSISTRTAVLLPQAWLEWFHEFQQGNDNLSGYFANDPSRIPFALATDGFDKNYFRLGIGMGAQFGQGRTAYLTYETVIGMNDYREQSLSLGVRLEF
jgi:outer membrane autotransporter protein